jgi:uncharacterized protein (DUF1697 family)
VAKLVALLRGVNVGGRAKVSMPELRSLLSELGLEDVATYIQSGNVLFRTGASAKDVAGRIEKVIADAFGLDVTVIVRTPAQLEAVARGNPFLADESDPRKLHVVFLSERPPGGAGSRLDPQRSPPDRFHLHGRELYLHLPNGAGRSKLTNDYLERQLGVRATARNWRTLLELIDLVRA